ncbi:helix-turn-helix domain-containing protein [Reichenbachiella ulvae]|uniref:Helix-turn-helix domain-containing protein n=1 Tax=Reichenbachiella ulvae TaxID=2980104 RepID=A0ABT3CZN9_9BACT|nr:helix-turn-helix transcriptional regulator [Reichenbachiella ulvae]MCV9389151.1 helix-turn-helix domain-containing protein [Reichenbachiella ulvae]
MLKDQFANVIRDLRMERGLSQEKLGFLAGLDRTYIWRIENAKRVPSIEVLFMLAKGLEINPSEIILKVENSISAV